MFICFRFFGCLYVVSELVPFLYVKKFPTAFASISTHGFFPMFCNFFFCIDPIFKKNSRQSSYSNPRKVFFRQVYKPLGRLQILSSQHSHYIWLSISTASSKSTLKCVRYWSSSASSWPSHLLVMLNSMYWCLKIFDANSRLGAHSQSIWFDSFLDIFQHSGSPPVRDGWFSSVHGKVILVRKPWKRPGMRCIIYYQFKLKISSTINFFVFWKIVSVVVALSTIVTASDGKRNKMSYEANV
jgi:hypothetical protein